MIGNKHTHLCLLLTTYIYTRIGMDIVIWNSIGTYMQLLFRVQREQNQGRKLSMKFGHRLLWSLKSMFSISAVLLRISDEITENNIQYCLIWITGRTDLARGLAIDKRSSIATSRFILRLSIWTNRSHWTTRNSLNWSSMHRLCMLISVIHSRQIYLGTWKQTT